MADCITSTIRTFSLTEPPNAVAAKGGQMAIRPTNEQHNMITETVGTEVAVGIRAKSRRARRAWITSCLGVLVLGSTGCGSVTRGVDMMLQDVHESIDDSMVDYRNRALAEKAWIRIRHCYSHHQYHRDFKDGFVSGYMDVAAGGNGCTPALAPSEYWGWRYQSPYGQAAINAWFEAYPLGAKAAEQDGVGYWQNIRMNLRTPGDGSMPVQEYGADSGVPVPMYSEDEILLTPQPESQVIERDFETFPSPSGRAIDSENEVEILDPESVFYQPSSDEDWIDSDHESGIVADLEVASRPDANRATKLTVPSNSSQEFSDEFVNDLFGTPAGNEAGSGSEELPFSFE